MSLAAFNRAPVVEGLVCELSRGVVEVSEIPARAHQLIEEELRKQFYAYDAANPGVIRYMGNGVNAKLLVYAYESERHADWSIYLTPMPAEDQPWANWIPDLVVEIVSPSSIRRDYEEKPAEYLALGVREYWVVDPIRGQVLVKSNVGGLWADAIFKPTQKIKTLRLPRFAFDVRRALAAAQG